MERGTIGTRTEITIMESGGRIIDMVKVLCSIITELFIGVDGRRANSKDEVCSTLAMGILMMVNGYVERCMERECWCGRDRLLRWSGSEAN